MKKIVFIFLLSGLCLNVFSQDNIPVVNDSVSKKGMESTDSIDNRISKDTIHVDVNASVSKMENDSTNSIVEAITPSKSECNEFKAMADKLDLIHKEIQERRNDDNQELEEAKIKWEAKFKDLEKTNGIWEEENNEIKEGVKKKKIDELKAENEQLTLKVTNLTNTNNKNTQEISTFKRDQEESLKRVNKEKKRVEDDIQEMFNYQGLISKDLLKRTKIRAEIYHVVENTISDLNTFIKVSKIVIDTKHLLSNRYNEKVETQLNILENNRDIKFDFLKNEINSHIDLLDDYCNLSLKLFKMFEYIEGSGDPDENLIESLKEERYLFISYPFLSEEINKKIKDIDYKSQVQECY